MLIKILCKRSAKKPTRPMPMSHRTTVREPEAASNRWRFVCRLAAFVVVYSRNPKADSSRDELRPVMAGIAFSVLRFSG